MLQLRHLRSESSCAALSSSVVKRRSGLPPLQRERFRRKNQGRFPQIAGVLNTGLTIRMGVTATTCTLRPCRSRHPRHGSSGSGRRAGARPTRGESATARSRCASIRASSGPSGRHRRSRLGRPNEKTPAPAIHARTGADSVATTPLPSIQILGRGRRPARRSTPRRGLRNGSVERSPYHGRDRHADGEPADEAEQKIGAAGSPHGLPQSPRRTPRTPPCVSR